MEPERAEKRPNTVFQLSISILASFAEIIELSDIDESLFPFKDDLSVRTSQTILKIYETDTH